MKKYFIFFTIIYFILIPIHHSIGSTTTGFIPGQIWYSKDPLIEGDTVKIYTALFNSGSSSLTAKVEFYDKNVVLGTRDIIVPSLKVEDISISWKVTSGDHLISAKIISPTIILAGKKESVIVDNNLTLIDRKFVPVVLTTIEGKPATSSDVIKSQVDKATSSIDNIVPKSISTPISENISTVDSFRINTLEKILETKIDTKTKIDKLNKLEEVKKSSTLNTNKNTQNTKQITETKDSLSNATDKPIAYIKLFFFTILNFVFGSKFIFYLLILVIIFLIIRGIYRKIRNR